MQHPSYEASNFHDPDHKLKVYHATPHDFHESSGDFPSHLARDPSKLLSPFSQDHCAWLSTVYKRKEKKKGNEEKEEKSPDYASTSASLPAGSYIFNGNCMRRTLGRGAGERKDIFLLLFSLPSAKSATRGSHAAKLASAYVERWKYLMSCSLPARRWVKVGLATPGEWPPASFSLSAESTGARPRPRVRSTRVPILRDRVAWSSTSRVHLINALTTDSSTGDTTRATLIISAELSILWVNRVPR